MSIKLSSFIVILFLISGCSSVNPPSPNKAKGEWIKISTTQQDLKGL